MLAQRWETAAFRSQKLKDAARDQSCVNCGANDGTVVLAHLAWAGVADRGTGTKCDEWAGAHLCSTCHTAADSGEYQTDFFWRTQMTYRTLRRLFNQGVIEVKRKKQTVQEQLSVQD